MLQIQTIPGSSKSNSYITLADAEQYFTNYGRITPDATWNTLTDNQKSYALILAAQALNTLTYKGKKIIKSQPLAFPRYNWVQINNLGKKQFNTFDEATNSDNIYLVVSNAVVDVSNNTFVFSSSINTEYLEDDLVIKVDGVSNNSGYFTVKSYDDTSITVYETLTDEVGVTLDVYPTQIYGVPQNVKYAQAELAWIVIDTNIFQKNITDSTMPEPSFIKIGGAISLQFTKGVPKLKFGSSTLVPSDIVYLLLSEWISATGGAVV